MLYCAGDVVQTLYGVGVVVKTPDAPKLQQEQEQAQTQTQAQGTKDSESPAVSSPSSSEPSSNSDALFYQVLLWRIPGKSIGSASVAYLQENALLSKLPAAPGMITTKRQQKAEEETDNDANNNDPKESFLVLSYSPTKKSFWVVPMDTAYEQGPETSADGPLPVDGKKHQNILAKRLSKFSRSGYSMLATPEALSITNTASRERATEIPESMLELATSAKFYPLMYELMRRGDKTATATSTFVKERQPDVDQLVQKTTKIVHDGAEKAKVRLSPQKQMKGGNSTETPEKDVTMIDDLETSVRKAAPKEEQVQQLLTMLKDEELTSLLEKGKQRLEQLLQKDIPEATQKALEKNGIRIAVDEEDIDDKEIEQAKGVKTITNSKRSYRAAMVKSQKAALAAMEKLLKDANVNGIDNVDNAKQLAESIRSQMDANFTTMFDSLAKAAKSDRNLSSIFETISGKTAVWQEASGRLMSTRSASLFLEGASRIQARAVTILSKNKLDWAGELGSKFTKAFTEGDAAVARLKSIELGDTVRNRLVSAIEVRSESLGGLDGIIAGALTGVKARTEGAPSNDKMAEILTKVQSRASTFSKDANETLITVLAKKSEFRDVALLKVEQVFCDLNTHLGEDMSPEDIAAVARGEGGTAKLFEPVAKRAAKEIEKQLDVAETTVKDKTMLDVLKHVRKIVSGQLTVGAVMDEVVNILNDKKVVAAGENVLAASENVLDAIEGVSGNKVVTDVMQIAEKAGITKDAVMQGIEKIDVNELLDTAGNAMTDETARKALLSDATDTALDFILRILPSMPIPPFDGVRDGLVYHISNLSMEGFKVKKESIFVEVAGMRATKKKKETQRSSSFASSSNQSDIAASQSASSDEDLDHPSILRTNSTDSSVLEVEPGWLQRKKPVKATELLVIDVQEVSAEFKDATWEFEQTYMPYLKGNGKADVKMFNGGIRLAFELRRRLKDNTEKSDEFDAAQWQPVLCLHDRQCSIGSVDLSMQGGGRLAWVVNKLAAIFKGALRDYVVRTILNILSERSGWILSKLNEGLSPYWDVIMRTAKLNMEGLEEATSDDIVAAKPVKNTNLIELVWRDTIPLGMNLLLNDESGNLKIVDFPRGSQARAVCERRKLDPAGFEGATIVAVNGVRHLKDDDLYEALRDPGRPKTVMFELADSEDAERVKRFVTETLKKDSIPEEDTGIVQRQFKTKVANFENDEDLGIEFSSAPYNLGLAVNAFLDGPDNVVLAAERNGSVDVGDILTHINGQLVIGSDGKGREQALKLLEEVGRDRPLALTFTEPYITRALFEKPESLPATIGGPSELILEETKSDESRSKRILVKGFNAVDGVAEHSGVLLGDHLVFINGNSVGAGCRWLGEPSTPPFEEVMDTIKSKASYPIGLTFARPKQAQNRLTSYFISSPTNNESFTMDTADTICVTAEKFEQLGCVLESRAQTDVVVTDFEAVSGPFQQMMQPYKDSNTRRFHLSIESINGEFVPGYANTQIVRSAMERSWKSENRVEVLFCDDERKDWVLSIE